MGRVAGPSTIADGLHLDATWQQRLCSVRMAPLFPHPHKHTPLLTSPPAPCLQLDSEALNRKRAAHVLQAALRGCSMQSGGQLEEPWATYFRLFHNLEDFSLHLLQVRGPPLPAASPAAAAA